MNKEIIESENVAPVQLSNTELAVLKQVATGATNREIAHERGISEATVKKHLTNINGKLGTGNRTEAVRRALDLGIIELESSRSDDDADANDPSREADRETAKRLAEELERARRRTKQILRWSMSASVLVALIAAGLVWMMKPPLTPGDPTATPAPSPTPNRGASWGLKVRLPGERDGHAMVYADAMYVIGGESNTGVLSETRRYSNGMPLQSWNAIDPKANAVRDISAVAAGGRIFVPGGCKEDGQAIVEFEILDTEQSPLTWSSGPNLPEPRCDYALAEVNGRLYLFGGRTESDPESSSKSVWSYRFGEEGWREEAELPFARSGMSAAVIGEEIHLLGGRDIDGEPQSNHWIFDTRGEGKFVQGAGTELPSPRADHVSAGISLLGRIYLVGGTEDREDAVVLRLDLDMAEDERAWEEHAEIDGNRPRFDLAMAQRNEGREIWISGGRNLAGERMNNTRFFHPLRD